MIKRRNNLARKSEKGQGFVELGLSLMFLIILLGVVIDLGWAFFTLIALRDAAQEAASVGAVCPTNKPRVMARLKAAATSPIDMSKLEDDRITIDTFDTTTLADTSSSPKVGDSIKVEITYDHDIMVPLIGSFIGRQSYPLTVNAVDTILTEDCRIKD